MKFEASQEDGNFSVEGNGGDLVRHTAEIVAAYVSQNSASVASVSDLIRQVHSTLRGLGRQGADPAGSDAGDRRPAVPVKKSIQPDFIVCLEDGRKFKSLKRYLRTQYSLTPEQYRSRWSLPHDYPMVAPNYAKARSDLAKNMGLGRRPVREVRRSRS